MELVDVHLGSLHEPRSGHESQTGPQGRAQFNGAAPDSTEQRSSQLLQWNSVVRPPLSVRRLGSPYGQGASQSR
jgi:hypothetical protein